VRLFRGAVCTTPCLCRSLKAVTLAKCYPVPGILTNRKLSLRVLQILPYGKLGSFGKVFVSYRSLLVRIWDVENKRKQKTVIVVKSKERGARTKVTACCYSPDSRYIGGGALLKSRSLEIYLRLVQSMSRWCVAHVED